jgi:hypothetical protein
MTTKQEIIHWVMTNNTALARALVLLNNRQTLDEQRSEETKHSNQRGFNAAHAKRGTSMANWFLRTGFLTPKQMAWWRAPARVGGKTCRIAMYAEQLLEEAKIKEANKLLQR